MKACCCYCFALLLSIGAAARAAEPSDASIEELMRLSKIDQLMDSVTGQVDAFTDQAMKTARPTGGDLNAAQQQTLDRMRVQVREAQHELLDSASFKPMIIRIYKQSFSQQDIDGIIKFYRTPAGRSMVDKMPLVMQNMMREMQGSMRPFMEKVQKITQDGIREMRAEADPAPKP